jgi:hypothetical protein
LKADVYDYDRRIARYYENIRSRPDLLENCGYSVEMPGMVEGFSGISHRFDILARKHGPIVVEVVKPHRPADEVTVLSLYMKIIDISNILAPSKVFLVTSSKLSPMGRKLAQEYKIIVIEARKTATFAEKFKKQVAP